MTAQLIWVTVPLRWSPTCPFSPEPRQPKPLPLTVYFLFFRPRRQLCMTIPADQHFLMYSKSLYGNQQPCHIHLNPFFSSLANGDRGTGLTECMNVAAVKVDIRENDSQEAKAPCTVSSEITGLINNTYSYWCFDDDWLLHFISKTISIKLNLEWQPQHV